MRIAIAAQSLAMRLGLRELLSSLPGIEVSAVAAAPRELPEVDVLVLTSTEDLQSVGDEPRPVLLLSNALNEIARLARLGGAAAGRQPRGTLGRATCAGRGTVGGFTRPGRPLAGSISSAANGRRPTSRQSPDRTRAGSAPVSGGRNGEQTDRTGAQHQRAYR